MRSAIGSDLPTLVQFNLELAKETEDLILDAALVERGVKRGYQQAESCRYFVVEEAGTIVGQLMVTFEWSDWRAGYFWWIQSVFVAKRARGRGVFRALYNHVERLARDKASECCGLRLYVEHGNTKAAKVYEDVGMARTHYHMYEIDWT